MRALPAISSDRREIGIAEPDFIPPFLYVLPATDRGTHSKPVEPLESSSAAQASLIQDALALEASEPL